MSKKSKSLEVWARETKIIEQAPGYILYYAIEDKEYMIGVDDINIEQHPSKIASKVLGIDIYHDWDLSFLKDPLNRKENTMKENTYKVLLKHNDDLQCLHDMYPDKEFDIWMGALSKFNLMDIHYYLQFNFVQRPPEILEFQRKIEKHLHFGLGWILSPTTLQLIYDKIINGDMYVNLSLKNLDF